MKYQACLPAAMMVMALAVGCDPGDPVSKAFTAKAAMVTKTYPVKGVVRKVNAQAGEVTISHEAIPGFMGKMTMPFTIKDKRFLEDVQPGDEVEGPLDVTTEAGSVKEMQLADLTVTRPSQLAAEQPARPSMAALPRLTPGELVPDFTMITQDGLALRLSDLKGQVVVLTFIYTRCPSPEFCPATDAKFADLARRISTVPGRADHARLLSISFDPEHDTPEVLTAHAQRRGTQPPLWIFAVASHEELSKVAGPLGLTYVPGTREIDHNLSTAVIGPDGRLARLEVGQGWTPSDLLKTVYALIPTSRK